jgi:competence protein ComFC
MYLLKLIYRTILDAIFPLNKEQIIISKMSPIQAYNELRKSPKVPENRSSAIFAYKDLLVTQLIWNIKYKKDRHSIDIAGYALYQKICSINSNILIVPIPITKRRRRERGFNQCELLAKAIKSFDKTNQIIIENNLLIRPTHKSRQTLKSRQERIDEAKNIFAVNESMTTSFRDKIKNTPHQIIVIDDVITTGSTIAEAIRCLEKVGFTNIIGLSVAH